MPRRAAAALALALVLTGCGAQWNKATVSPAAFSWTDSLPGDERDTGLMALDGDVVAPSEIVQRLESVPVGVKLTVPLY